MLDNPKHRNAFSFLMGLCALTISADFEVSTARAQEAPAATTASAPQRTAQKSGKPYFIEFRARSAHNYGHTFRGAWTGGSEAYARRTSSAFIRAAKAPFPG